MKTGTIEVEGTGITNGHPAVIIAGKIKVLTDCKVNGLLSLDESTGEFEAYSFSAPSGAACVALEKIASGSSSGTAKVLLHGTFDGSLVVKPGDDPLTNLELAAVQANSQIYFV
jgi:hypothetical protein